MILDTYQQLASRTDLKSCKNLDPEWLYYVLGLCGEAGEVAEKVKKVFRDSELGLRREHIDAVILELGDVLWYLSQLSLYFGVSLSEVAEMNLKKLSSRQERDKIKGDGDDR